MALPTFRETHFSIYILLSRVQTTPLYCYSWDSCFFAKIFVFVAVLKKVGASLRDRRREGRDPTQLGRKPLPKFWVAT
jgi:hypothetical protein